jgi:hypothetical protein
MDEFSQCAVCARTPVIGEGVAVVRRGPDEVLVCDCCRRKPRAAALGEPIRRERIHSLEGAANVKRTFPKPVRLPRLPTEQPARA